MASRSFTVNVHVTGMRETLRAFNQLPKDANKELRDASQDIARMFAARAKWEARADRAPQSRLVVPTIKARRDRVPVVVAGGTRRVGRRRVPVWKVLFGSEFGSDRFEQFGRPHSGRKGYWFFPLVDKMGDQIGKAWLKAADRIVAKFGRGGR